MAERSETDAKGASSGAGVAGRTRLGAMLVPAVLFAAMAGLFWLALQKGDPSRLPSALIGKPVPQMDLAPVEGLTRAAAPMPGLTAKLFADGKPTVVNFWASWCLPCVEEHPFLADLVRRTGVRLVGINQKDQPANAARFLAQHGNPFVAVGSDANGRAAIEWGVYGTPETFIVDGQGVIVFKHVGPITAGSLATKVLPALAKATEQATKRP